MKATFISSLVLNQLGCLAPAFEPTITLKQYTGMRPFLAKYHFWPVHYYIIFRVLFCVSINLHNNALARNGPWRELVTYQYTCDDHILVQYHLSSAR